MNAAYPIEVTLFGMIIMVRLEQKKNVPSPIEVTPSGIVILAKDVQLLNA